MHFFRALWRDDLKSNGFTVKNSALKKINYRDIVVQKDNGKEFFTYSENLVIYYHFSDRYEDFSSKIIFLKDQVLFEQDGYFDPSGIQWEGQMAEKRIADWLPYEYSVEE